MNSIIFLIYSDRWRQISYETPFFLYSTHDIDPERLDSFLSSNNFTLLSENHWGYNGGGIWVWITRSDNPFHYLAKGYDIQKECKNDADCAVIVLNEFKELCDEAIEIINRLGAVPQSILLMEIKSERLTLVLEIIENLQTVWPCTILDNFLDEVCKGMGIDVNKIQHLKTRKKAQDPDYPQT